MRTPRIRGFTGALGFLLSTPKQSTVGARTPIATALLKAFSTSCSPRLSQQSDWSATQYLKFNDERTMPVRDLISKIPSKDPKLVIDMGCGPGNSTVLLAEAYPDAKLMGMDSSPDMLAKATKSLPNVKFFQADLATYRPEQPPDILFSNAVFHWLPADQRVAVMKDLLHQLAPGGVLAIQVPDNFNEPSHSLMREVAGHWQNIPGMQSAALAPFQAPTLLYSELQPLCSSVNIWHTHYYHLLKDHAAIVEWVKGTGLRPYLDLLNPEQQEDFMEMYLQKLKGAYRDTVKDGRVVLTYPRLFVVAVRK